MKNKNNTTFGSILIGVLTFGLLGFSVYSLLTRLDLIAINTSIMTITLLTGGAIGGFLGIKYPITTEATSFAVMALIVVQSLWDATYDIQTGLLAPRVIVGGIALSIFILNIFTGKLKRGTAKKQIRRTLGAK